MAVRQSSVIGVRGHRYINFQVEKVIDSASCHFQPPAPLSELWSLQPAYHCALANQKHWYAYTE